MRLQSVEVSLEVSLGVSLGVLHIKPQQMSLSGSH